MKNYFLIILILLIFTKVNAQKSTYNNTTIVFKIKSFNTTKSKTSETLERVRQITKSEIDEIKPIFHNFNIRKEDIPHPYDLSTLYKIKLKNSDHTHSYLQELNRLENIEYAELYPVAVVFDTPNDPYIGNQYYLNTIKAADAHEISKGDTNIVIGIVDSGVDLLHEDLKGNFNYNYNDPINNKDDDMDGYIDNYYGWDMADNDLNPQSLVNSNGEANYHGTKVAGMASAVTNNGIGIASIGYNTKILPIKVMDSTGYITAGYEGIIYAADHGCDIINCSWGSNFPSKFGQDVINYATLYKNCVVVAAAGNKSAAYNGRPDTWFYPASYENVLSVAATNGSDLRWNGSSYATSVDVSAPGENVYFTKHNSTYGSGSGTSYAAPIVAGLAGLLKAQRPYLSQKQIAEQIRVTSDVIDTLSENSYYSKQLGYGRINAYKTLTIQDMPSVRIDSLMVTTNKMNALLAGDTLQVVFSAINYLAQVTNTTIRLTSNSSFIEPLTNIISTGKLETMESIKNTETPLLLKVASTIPYNEKIWLVFEIAAEGYNDYQVFELRLNKNFIDINENEIQTSLTSNGMLGYADRYKNIGTGFIYKNTHNFLNTGGIIIGNNNTNIASSLFTTKEFSSTIAIDTSRNSSNELVGNTTYRANSDTELNLSVHQTTVASNNEPLQATISYLYTLKNEGTAELTDLKMSQFVDWDLFHYAENRTAFNTNLNLFYTYSGNNEVVYVGICLLNDMLSLPYGFDLVAGGNGGIDITSGFSNELKWFTMTNQRRIAGNNGDSVNVAAMLTTDYFSIAPNDSIEIAFAHIVGTNYNDLVKKTTAVRELYQKTSIASHKNKSLSIYPNPANTNLTLSFNKKEEKVALKIYDREGRICYSRSSYNQKSISINIADFAPGIYFISYLTNSERKSAKFIKVP